MGLGTGDPVSRAQPQEGETVVDLGSGAGVDAFLAAREVGPTGEVIGVDLTFEMVERARRLAADHGIGNATFLQTRIEDLPLAGGIADVVVSNCVINLSPDGQAALEEAFRLLKPGGRLVVSDTVRLGQPEEGCGCGCSSGALTPEAWRGRLDEVGFSRIQVEAEPAEERFGPGMGTGLVEAVKPA